jgi:aryl-alcohol dehydrogenase-like predicted oxidoreductase
VQELARDKGCTPAQLALAWLLNRPDVIPIPGTSSQDRLIENARAADLHLSESEIARIEKAVPRDAAAGERYDPAMLDLVDG